MLSENSDGSDRLVGNDGGACPAAAGGAEGAAASALAVLGITALELKVSSRPKSDDNGILFDFVIGIGVCEEVRAQSGDFACRA